MAESKKEIIAEALLGIVEKAKSGGPVTRIGLMAFGSELGPEEVLQGGLAAQNEHPGLKVTAFGPKTPGFDALEWVETPTCEADVAAAVEKALDEGSIDGAVAMHFPFPIGVATVGRIITPGKGRPMFIASCTGATASGRGESLLRNAVYGIAVAKACGIETPSVAFLNSDGAGPALRALGRMKEKGYAVTLGTSQRGDGGSLLRGNDIVSGAVDVLVCDTLTGNAFIKIFSTYTTGGHYESMGYGYGPSVGEGWGKVVSIISRASGAPVVANALALTARAASSGLPGLVDEELKAARASGFNEELDALKPAQPSSGQTAVEKPAAVPVDAEIAGVDVLDMDAAVQALWKEGIYAETAMGCTGPVVRVQSGVKAKAADILKAAGYV